MDDGASIFSWRMTKSALLLLRRTVQYPAVRAKEPIKSSMGLPSMLPSTNWSRVQLNVLAEYSIPAREDVVFPLWARALPSPRRMEPSACLSDQASQIRHALLRPRLSGIQPVTFSSSLLLSNPCLSPLVTPLLGGFFQCIPASNTASYVSSGINSLLHLAFGPIGVGADVIDASWSIRSAYTEGALYWREHVEMYLLGFNSID